MNTLMQQWEGVNERTVPEILKLGIFHKSTGVTWRDYNGAGRIKGKSIFASLQNPILNISVSATQLFVQTTQALLICPLDSILQDTTWTDEANEILTDDEGNPLHFEL